MRGIEARCHDALIKAGLVRLPDPMREVFALGTKMTYAYAVNLCDEVVANTLLEAIGQLQSNKRLQKTLAQKKQEEQRAEAAERQRVADEAPKFREEARLRELAQAETRRHAQLQKEQRIWEIFMAQDSAFGMAKKHKEALVKKKGRLPMNFVNVGIA